eukprot:Colp12_sorted_trinity150504_noHs@15960
MAIDKLRAWLGIVGATALVNCTQCFILKSSYLHGNLFTVSEANITDLTARMFGSWTFLAGLLRLYCAADINSKSTYQVTMWSFALVFAEFAAEVFLYNTAALTPGIVLPFIISGGSFLWMAAE